MKKVLVFTFLLCCILNVYSQKVEKITLSMVKDKNSKILPYIEKSIKFDSENLCEIENGFYIIYFSSNRSFMLLKSEVSNDDILDFDSYTIVNDKIVLIRNCDESIYERSNVTKDFEYVSVKNDMILSLNKIGTTWYFTYSQDNVSLNSIKFCEDGVDILKLH